jgi:uncharacterized membrane protein
MIQQLKLHGRLNGTLLLTFMSLFSFSLSMIRYTVTDSKMYVFLNWNLFLAIIPWILSTSIIIYNYQRKKLLLAILLTSWLLFFPNSPYILTDLFHLKTHSAAPVWFDWALILSFAWTGLMFGFCSLRDIEKILSLYINRKYIIIFVISLLFVAGFGVYVGRFLRWNSWDVLSSPLDLGEDILNRFIHPLRFARTWIITFLLGVLLTMMYFSPRVLKN